ncbi:MAG: recombination protein NinG, partial [Caulobacteraceae bacterium]|nr:recombination protein NinG [Caulobacteraceae bacterium]
GKALQGKYDAGHYYSVGSYPNLRFHESNVHGQCVTCNQHKHGNLLEYNEGIVRRIGKNKLEELKSIRNDRLSLPLDMIKEKIEHYKSLVNQMK